MSDSNKPQTGMTLPQPFFTSPEMYNSEREKLFFRHWFCVGRASELPQPGAFILADVAGEQVICTLDDEGRLRGFYNNCRHRGTRLVTESSGEFSSCKIQCPYHRWTYSCRGDLVTAPRADEDPEFCVEEWPLQTVNIASWQGFLLVNLSEQPRSLVDVFSSFINRLDPWQTDSLLPVHTEVYELTTNWKLVLENFNECYHCSSIHPGLAQLSPPRSATNDFSDGLLLGGPMELAKESMTMTGRRCCDAIDTLSAEDRRRTYYYTLFPNLLLAMHPDFVLAWRLHPIAPDRTRIICQWLFPPDRIQLPEFDASGAIEFWEMTNRQDWDICQKNFDGIRSRGYQSGPYMANEVVLKMLDQRILQALEIEPEPPR